MHAPRPLPLLPALPAATLLAYAGAHFGKSLLWYTGELLLIFALTEHAGLDAIAAGCAVAAGLLLSAAMGLLAARRWGAGTSLAWAGRSQWRGIALAALSLLLLFLVPLLPASTRLGCVLLLSLPFRAAYAVGDVAQNALLGLGRWPWRGARGVSALRLIGSGLAAVSISAAIGLVLQSHQPSAPWTALMVVAVVSSIALLSAAWLLQALRPYTQALAPAPRTVPVTGRQADQLSTFAVMALLCCALPTFTKLAPYLAQSRIGAPGWSSAILMGYALGTVAVQQLAARWRTNALTRLAGSGAVLAALGMSFAAGAGHALWLDTAMAFGMGMAGGSAGQWVWARHAELSCQQPAQHAAGVARLTACAQVALALGSILIGLMLNLGDGHGRGHVDLVWAMAAGPMLCGTGCLLLAYTNGLRNRLNRRPLAKSGLAPRRG
ncbi:MFS transporter [Xanthomonas campestris]|uniref:MFS transporter n=1 Tax=Xanthomonas campestris TaxID=339 RepID=UPI0035574081